MTRGKQYRAGWEHPDTARRRAVAVRRIERWLVLASTRGVRVEAAHLGD